MKTTLLCLALACALSSSAPAANYYLNPATGNDGNNGTAANTAWQTAARLNVALANGTIAGSAWPWAFKTGAPVPQSLSTPDLLAGVESGEIVFAGDSIFINTATGPWSMDRGIYVQNKSGVRITTATPNVSARLTAFQLISSGQWTASSGLSGVYQTAATEPYAVLWEDRKWLAHINGTTLAAVQSALVSTAGSFWTDGTSLYVHPIGGGNPSTNGKVYERSRYLSGADGHAVMLVGSSNCVVESLAINGLCMARPSDGAPEVGNGYGIYFEGSNSAVLNCTTTYTNKHGIGMIGGASGKFALVRGCTAEQGSPYGGAGSQTPFIAFGASGVTIRFRNCVCSKDSGLLGSSAGQARPLAIPALYSHQVGSSTIEVLDSNFSGTQISGEAATTLRRSTVGTFAGYGVCGADACYFDAYGPWSQAGANMTISNCLWKPADLQNTVQQMGTCVLDSCTLDGTLIAYPFNGFFNPNAGLALTIKNSIFVSATGTQVLLVSTPNTLSANTITFANNVYRTGPGGKIVLHLDNYAGNYYLSPAELASASLDTGSVAGDPLLDGSYRPGGGSPALGLASAPTTLSDGTGVIFSARTTAGAYEPATPGNTLGTIAH